MQAFDLNQLVQQRADSGDAYLEFLRESSMSMGLYVLLAGDVDPQQPHGEDEVYVVMSGRGQIVVDDEDRAVAAGSVVFVAAGIEHRFHSIEKELRVLVFFAPAEYANQQQETNHVQLAA